jgi:hypothetical protein
MNTHNEFLANILGVRQDVSLPILQDLRNQGYDSVTWHTNPGSVNPVDISLDGNTWTLDEFLYGLMYDAPIFERTHVQCLCSISVTSSTIPELPEVFVNANGIVEDGI